MKSKYIVIIEETVSENFEIFAENREQALEYAENKYNKGEFVLESGNLIFKQIAITLPDEEVCEWYEF